MQRRATIHVQRVDLTAESDDLLNHLNLIGFQEHGVMQRRPSAMIFHSHQFLFISTFRQNGQDFGFAGGYRVVYGSPSAVVPGFWVSPVLNQQLHNKCITSFAPVM